MRSTTVWGMMLIGGLLGLPGSGLADVGHNACTPTGACTGNTGNVKNNSCDGDFACFDNTGAIGNGSGVLTGTLSSCTDARDCAHIPSR